MLRRDFLRVAAASPFAAALAGQLQAAEGKQRKILFFTKSSGFQHSAIKREGDQLGFAEKTLIELGKQHNFDVVATKDGTVFDSDLDQFDAFFFYTTGDLTQVGNNDGQPPMSPAGKKKFIDAVAAGKGFLASHCGSDTFHSPGERREEQKPADYDPYIAMLGGEFISHGPQQKSRQVILSPSFPGLDGLGKEFEMHDEWYSLKNFAADLHVILLQDTQGMTGEDYERPPFPATWARNHGKGRVFYTSMGHREDVWTNPTFQQILLGGIAWATGNVEFTPTPNLEASAPGARIMPPPKKPKPEKAKPKK